MGDVAAWIAVGIGLVGLGIAYITFANQRNTTRLEYVVLLNTRLLRTDPGGPLEVRWQGARHSRCRPWPSCESSTPEAKRSLPPPSKRPYGCT